MSVDLGSVDTSSVTAVGTGQRTATTLAAAAAAGDTNIKVASVTNMVVGEKVAVDAGFDNAEYRLITAVGTAGAAGTGVTLDSALSGAHASGNPVQDVGSGITLSSALANAHRVTARVVDTSALGTGITLTAPLAKAHAYGSTVNGSATGLISDSPQGQIIGVFNNDQDGLNYPTHKWGTGYYMSNLLDGQAGPWFNNINATPVSAAPNNIYGTVGIQRLQHNLPAVQAFRASAEDAVSQALQDLGAKYNFSIPLENPLQFKNTGSVPDSPGIHSVPAYLPADQAQYTPVLDDRTGRTDQVSFGVRGIPSLGDIGQYDSSTDPLVGGADNPYPSYYPSKPTIAGEFGQDSTSDYFSNLNYWASGTVHGPGGFDKPSEGLLRGVEFIATWFSYAIASPQEGGHVSQPKRPIAYFEMTPRKPTAQTTVTFDAGFSRTKSGSHGRPDVLLGLRGRQPDGEDREPADPAHVPDPGGVARREAARRGRWPVERPVEVRLVPAGRADRLLPDVLPGARTADRARRAHDRFGGRPVRCADRGRAGRVDRGGSRREAGRGVEPDAGGHRERRADKRRLEERRRGIAVSETPSRRRGRREAPSSF